MLYKKQEKFIKHTNCFYFMTKKPLFSVLMANYNNGKYIKEAINSVLNQTYPNWELVIVDDGSTDNSLEMIKPFLQDKRIKLIIHEKNRGCGATKKDCAENATGKIFGILDSDDILHNQAISIMVEEYTKNPATGMIYSNNDYCNENMQFISKSTLTCGTSQNGSALLKKYMWGTYHFQTFRKSCYLQTSGFDSSFKRAVDKDILYKLEELVPIKYIDRVLYNHRRHSKGISQNDDTEIFVYVVVAMLKAYKRRLNLQICNLTKNEMSDLIQEAISKSDNRNELIELLMQESEI